jgi:hypothetical protein
MTAREVEHYLLGLELFGIRFGLDRKHRVEDAVLDRIGARWPFERAGRS